MRVGVVREHNGQYGDANRETDAHERFSPGVWR